MGVFAKVLFISLVHLLTEDFLKCCFLELKRDKASGIDEVSVEEYEVNLEEKVKDLVARLKARRYRPQPIRRVYIPKSDGSKRGLGVSTVEDQDNNDQHYILDLWFEKEFRKQLNGFAQLVRYADDFIVCFQSGREAEAFGEALRQRLDRFGLKIAEGKSRIIEFGRYVWQKAQRQGRKVATFDFLGFTHYCNKTRSGKFKLE